MIDPIFQVENTTSKGRFGEKIALRYLLRKGYKFIRSNFYIRGGELDLIMEKNDIITIVEVKLRSGKNFGRGAESFGPVKNRNSCAPFFPLLEAIIELRRGSSISSIFITRELPARPISNIFPIFSNHDR